MVVYSTELAKVTITDMPDEIDQATMHEYATLPSFRVRTLPVVSPIPAMFGAGLAAYVLSQLSGTVSIDPLASK